METNTRITPEIQNIAATAFDNHPSLSCVINLQNNILLANNKLRQLLNKESLTLNDQIPLTSIFLPDKLEVFLERISLLSPSTNTIEIEAEMPGEENKLLGWTFTKSFDREGNPTQTTGTGKDITKTKAERKILEIQALTDTLTNVNSRVAFEAQRKKLNEQRDPHSTIFIIDVNDLKIANDQYGHMEGDKVLINTTKILSQSVRTEDLICRIGGDEFAIIVDTDDQQIISQILNRINQNMWNFSNNPPSDQLPISVSVGYSSLRKDEKLSFDRAVKRADDMMYQQKRDLKERRKAQKLEEEKYIVPPQEADEAMNRLTEYL